MSLRLELLQAACLAPRLLGDSTSLVRGFFLRQQNPDGGFQDRSGRSDLYYTVFGLAGLAALAVQSPKSKVQSREISPPSEGESTAGAPPPMFHVSRFTAHASELAAAFAKTEEYLRTFHGGELLDFVHLCCLARSWAALSGFDAGLRCPSETRNQILDRIEKHRSTDGGYHPVPDNAGGTAYAGFLALSAYQDLQQEIPDQAQLVESLAGLQTPDGVWTNERPLGPAAGASFPAATNATVAALAVRRALKASDDSSAGKWILERAHPQGGFLASPTAPVPDLLSTATALHALSQLEVSIASLREKCLDFVDSLWTNEGGFYGHWADDHLDCEYTFYALLALGHLI